MIVLGSEAEVRGHGERNAPRPRRRAIVDGVEPRPFADLIGDDARRKRARAALGVAATAHLVVTNAAHGTATHGSATHGSATHGSARHGATTHGATTYGTATPGAATHDAATHGAAAHGAATHGAATHGAAVPIRWAEVWRARDRRGDVLALPPDVATTAATAALDTLAAADAALLVQPALRDALACLAAGLAVVIVGRAHEAELSWARRATLLDDSATADEIAQALARATGARSLAASTRRAQARLPRALTATGTLNAWRDLYDELVGPPRPTGEMARRRPLRRSRR